MKRLKNDGPEDVRFNHVETCQDLRMIHMQQVIALM
jgi:hypothetical protein